MDENPDSTEHPDQPAIDTGSESDPLPSVNDLQDPDGDDGLDDGSAPEADSLTTFLPHGLRLN